MFCKKSTVTNSSNKISSISYRRCSDNMIIPNHLLNPGEVVNIWYIEGTLLTAEQGQNISDTYSFPPISPSRTALPTRTPRSTPSITPSNTQTPTNSPTISLTASPTKSLGTTPNPTNSPTSTRNPNTTPQATVTPTITSLARYNVFRPQVRVQGDSTAQLSCSAANLQILSPLLIGYTTKPLNQLTTGDQIFDLQTNQPISFFSNRWQPFTDVEILTQNTPIYTTFFAAGSNSVISQIQNCFSVIPTPTPTISPTITSFFTYDVFQDCCSILDNQRTPSYISVLNSNSSPLNGFGFTAIVNNQNTSWVKIDTIPGSLPGSEIITYNGGFEGPNYCSTIDPIPVFCPNQPTPQPTLTPTVTNTVSPTNTPSPTTSRSFDTTPLPTPDATPTPTVSPTISPTVSPTVSVSPTRSFSPDSFVIEVEADSTLSFFKLPLVSNGSYNFTVSWGDGQTDVVQTFNSPNASHAYAGFGTYNIVISGVLNLWSFSQEPTSQLMLKKIKQWGTNVNLFKNDGATINGQFNNCFNLTSVDCPDLPILGTNLNNFFNGCRSLTTINRLNEWDMEQVTTANGMFRDCFVFNGNVSGWNMYSCSNLGRMFQNCYQFNSNLSNWNLKPNNTRTTIQLTSFLTNAQSYNSPIFSGITLELTNQSSVFSGCTIFNQPIVEWEFEKKPNFSLNLSNMFNGCTTFNQDIGYFSFSEITNINMTSMFRNAASFNQDLSEWCVSVVPTQPASFNTGANSTWVNTPSKQPRWGQLCYSSVTIGNVSAQVNSIVEVPVVYTINSPVNLGAMSIKIVYNPSLLSCADPEISYTWSGFTEYSSLLDNCTTFTENCGTYNAIVVGWETADLLNGTRFEGGELFKLRFNTLGTTGMVQLTMSCEGSSEIVNNLGTNLNVTFVSGSVNIT